MTTFNSIASQNSRKMNEILKFEGHDVRMIDKDGEPWWVAKDVCDVLGIGNNREALARIDPDDVGLADVIDAINRKQKTSIVNESGLYALILRSDKPEAKRMKTWLTREVLPSIRKTGKYEIAPVDNEPEDHDIAVVQNMLNMLKDSRRQLARLQSNVTTHGGQISTLGSHVAFLSDRVDLFGADTDYRTVRAHLRGCGVKMAENDARAVGVKAAALCRDRGIRIGDVADERHGSVHSYPGEVLDEAVAFVQERPKREPAKRIRKR